MFTFYRKHFNKGVYGCPILFGYYEMLLGYSNLYSFWYLVFMFYCFFFLYWRVCDLTYNPVYITCDTMSKFTFRKHIDRHPAHTSSKSDFYDEEYEYINEVVESLEDIIGVDETDVYIEPSERGITISASAQLLVYRSLNSYMFANIAEKRYIFSRINILQENVEIIINSFKINAHNSNHSNIIWAG